MVRPERARSRQSDRALLCLGNGSGGTGFTRPNLYATCFEMPLTLIVQAYKNAQPMQPIAKRFDANGGVIGRGQDADMILPDPDKYISRTHAKILFSSDNYYVCDLGNNPSLVNKRPVGKGKTMQLSDGDKLTIGEYAIQVSIEPEAVIHRQPVMMDDWEDPLAASSVLNVGPALSATDPLGLGLMGGASILPDPLTGALPGASLDKAYRGSESDHVAPESLPFPGAPEPIKVGQGAIPDNWDPMASLLIPSSRPGISRASPVFEPAPVPAPTVQLPAPQLHVPPFSDDSGLFAGIESPVAQTPVPEKVQANLVRPAAVEVVPVPPAAAVPAASVASGDGSGVLESLLKGLGLPGLKVAGRSDQEIAELIGNMLREAVGGTMSVLMARALTKQEVRIDATLIGTSDNNPLKFFPDPQSALTQMITGQWAGYMPPVKAIHAAFDDIKAHELAVMVGMRSALAGVLGRFDPEEIEKRLAEKTVMDKMFAGNRKAKMWDGMVDLYREISSEADNDFQRLFGEKFAEAYKVQVQRLKNGRNL